MHNCPKYQLTYLFLYLYHLYLYLYHLYLYLYHLYLYHLFLYHLYLYHLYLYHLYLYCKSLLCSMFNEQTCTRFTRLLFVTMPKIAFMPIYIDFEHWCQYISCYPDQTRPDQTSIFHHSKDLKVCLLTSDFCIVPPGLSDPFSAKSLSIVIFQISGPLSSKNNCNSPNFRQVSEMCRKQQPSPQSPPTT